MHSLKTVAPALQVSEGFLGTSQNIRQGLHLGHSLGKAGPWIEGPTPGAWKRGM